MSSLFTGVDRVSHALNYHLERHNILASNVANIETPGFRPLELVRQERGGANGNLRLAGTDERHLGSAPGGGQPGFEAQIDATAPVGTDGNGVALEREMAKVAANDLRYEGAVRVINRRLTMIRYAASDATR